MKKVTVLFLSLLLVVALAVPSLAVEHTFTHFADNIVIDGVIGADEWGKPMWSGTPNDVLAKRNNGWAFKRHNPVPEGQRAYFYATNDGDYMYVAAVLKNADYDDGCKSEASLTTYPHLSFILAQYHPITVVTQIVYQNAKYDQYAHYCLGLVNGEKASVCKSQGMALAQLDESDYAVRYDKASRSYIYECRVPFKSTYVTLDAGNKLVMSFDLCDANTGGYSGNRYVLSYGAYAAQAGGGAWYYASQKSDPFIITMLSTEQLAKNKFEPTEQELKAGGDTLQNEQTVTRYQQIDDHGLVLGLAIAAGVLIPVTVVVFIVTAKRPKKGEDQ